MAGRNPATRFERNGRSSLLRPAARAVVRGLAAIAALLVTLAVSSPASAAKNEVQITKLTDIAFGSISNVSADTTRTENVCIYSGTATSGYNVKARGSGTGNAYTLDSGGRTLAYDVQWAATSGQNVGASLTPNSTLGGLTTGAKNAGCTSAPTTTASLILIVRSAAASTATAGVYGGTLTLVFGPE